MSKKIWAVLQQRDGVLHRGAWEVVAAAHAVAGEVGGSVTAVILGDGIEAAAAEVGARAGIEVVLVASDPALAVYRPGPYVAALRSAIEEQSPDIVLFSHTYQSLDYFPRLAQAVGGAVVSNAVSFSMKDGELLWRRPILGGKLESDVRVKKPGPVLVSIQSAVFSADDVPPGTCTVEAIPCDLAAVVPDREILGVELAAEEELDLSKSEVIVTAGRGVGAQEKMKVIEDLAAALGADIGASRPVIDNGWLPRDRQIGSSGQTVSPKLYIAAGVSGAIQHLVAMKGSGCVVAVNKDASAPIFGVADYGIVGDLHEVLPALTAAIEAAKK